MPIVSDGIKIPFDAESQKLIAESNKVIAQLDRVKEATKANNAAMEKSAKQAQQAAKGTTSSWTEFRSMYSTVLDVVRVGQAVWDETGQKYIDNAITVGNLARAMGTTTEEASRLKEVADDVGIGIDSLKTSMKLALKDGFEPNIDGLARMSDEYLKLAPGTERMQYLLDRFGKSGEEMGKILEKGGDSIRSMAEAMDEGLIVTEEAYEQARQYQVSVDALKDSWDAFTYKAAPPLVDALTTILNTTRDSNRAAELAIEQGKQWIFLSTEQRNAFMDAAVAEREQADAAVLAKKSAEEASGAFETEAETATRLADEAKAAAEAIKTITKENEAYLDMVGKVSDSLATYEDKHADVQHQLDEGKITLDEAKAKWKELADEQELASHRMILSMLEQQLAVDGLSAKETAYLLDTGLKWGVYSKEAVQAAKEAQREVALLTNQLNNLPTEKRIAIYMQTVSQTMSSEGYKTYQQSEKGKASGGPVMSGEPYMVGERGPEMFVPDQSGNIVPNDRMGNTIVVNLNGVFSDPEKIAYQLTPAIKRVLRAEGVMRA